MLNLSPKDACMAYEFAMSFQDCNGECKQEYELSDKCLKIIRTRTDEVLRRFTLEKIKLETLLTVLDQDILEIHSEVELFIAVERWAKAECQRQFFDSTNGKCLRSVIGNAVSKIRFLNLTSEEFTEGVGAPPLLTKDEAFVVY